MMRDESEEKGTRRLCQTMARIHSFVKKRTGRKDHPCGRSI